MHDAVLPFVQGMEQCAMQEEHDLVHTEADKALYDSLIRPLNKCFFTYAYSTMFSSLIKLDEDGKPKSISAFSDAATKISNRVFSNANVQRALKRVWEKMYSICSLKNGAVSGGWPVHI